MNGFPSMTAAFALLLIAVVGVLGIIIIALLMASWRRYHARQRGGDERTAHHGLGESTLGENPSSDDPWVTAGRRLRHEEGGDENENEGDDDDDDGDRGLKG